MRPSELVGDIYENNTNQRGFNAFPSRHTFRVDVAEWPIEKDEVTFEKDDFPYLRVALLDKHLEETYEVE